MITYFKSLFSTGSTQWAAVRMLVWSIKAPPQKWRHLPSEPWLPMLTIQGHVSPSVPWEIRVSTFLPHPFSAKKYSFKPLLFLKCALKMNAFHHFTPFSLHSVEHNCSSKIVAVLISIKCTCIVSIFLRKYVTITSLRS